MATVPHSDDLLLRAAPVRQSEITSVELDGEAVLYVRGTGHVHRLDRVATVIWTNLDGSVTLADLAEDLSSVYVTDDPEVITADVLAYVRRLAGEGLLEFSADASDGMEWEPAVDQKRP